jgi:hypothetical protein
MIDVEDDSCLMGNVSTIFSPSDKSRRMTPHCRRIVTEI